MYIAFKWLLFLTVVMWLLTCSIHVLIGKNRIKMNKHQDTYNYSYKEISNKKCLMKNKTGNVYKHHSTVCFHYAMFVAGALFITIYNRHYITMNKLVKLDKKIETWFSETNYLARQYLRDLKPTAITVSVVMQTYFKIGWEKFKLFITFIRQSGCKMIYTENNKENTETKHHKLNLILIKKIKEIGEERKQLGHLLISAINENKNIRALYQLETLSKSRLQHYIENTNKVIKENRLRFNNFQQLYVVAHRENQFLKEQIKRISKQKNECEHKLMCVVNEVFRSDHTYLKEYCSTLIVNTRDNLLSNKVANEEIDKFLKSKTDLNVESNTNTAINKDINGNLERIVSEVPNFKGLPGEYVWTVKDKRGVIEKLYEYNVDADLDSGDTIRRIRQYTVYHDRDCFLDHYRSRTIVTENYGFPAENFTELANGEQKFLTGSEAFKKFLKNNSQNTLPIVTLSTQNLPTHS